MDDKTATTDSVSEEKCKHCGASLLTLVGRGSGIIYLLCKVCMRVRDTGMQSDLIYKERK